MDQNRIDAFNKRLASMPVAELQGKSEAQRLKIEADFNGFKDNLKNGQCFYCKNPISHFAAKKPCLHWLLKPKGFKKKHFPTLYEKCGFRHLNTYLRWVANTEQIAQNINDLVAEQSSTKFIEETISYKNIEWSFSCSESDRKGHSGAHKGAVPHYHFQMKVDGSVIINYNAFHIPFTDYDDFSFAVEEGKFDMIKAARTYDAGMQAIFDHMALDAEFVDTLRYTEDESNAAFNTNILIHADPGTTISGDDLADLFEERKRTGISLASLAKKLKNASVEAYISPGEGVPEIAKRSGGRKKNKK